MQRGAGGNTTRESVLFEETTKKSTLYEEI